MSSIFLCDERYLLQNDFFTSNFKVLIGIDKYIIHGLSHDIIDVVQKQKAESTHIVQAQCTFERYYTQ